MERIVILMALLTPGLAGAAPGPGHLELGIGTRDTVTEPGHAEGVRAVGRYTWPAWALELDLYATPSTARAWSRVDLYDEDPYVENYVDLDQGSAALLVDWGMDRDEGGPWLQLRPHVLFGAEVRRMVRRWPYSVLCTATPAYIAVEPWPTWTLGPDLGLALAVHTGPRLALRLGAMDRVRVRTETITYEDGLTSWEPYRLRIHDLTATVDLLVRFRAR